MKRLLHRAAILVASALLITSLVGCDSTVPTYHAFTIAFEGMTPHVGQRFGLRIVNSDGYEVERVWIAAIAGPSFEIDVALFGGETYIVDFYADLNGNSAYDAPPTDHAWRRFVGPLNGPVTLPFTHDTNWVDIEWP